jgi:hypothetical protein
MSGATNAILAINSLDRYTSSVGEQYSSFIANWIFQENYLILGDPTSPGAPFGTPIVGAIIDVVGAPANTRITQIVPGVQWGASVFLNKNMTNGNAPGTFVGQTYKVDATSVNPIDTILPSQFYNSPPYSNEFTIQLPYSLIYGYFKRIIVSQIQLEYCVPTVCPGKNNKLWFVADTAGNDELYEATIPFGFYSPEELAGMIEYQMDLAYPALGISVTYDSSIGNVAGSVFNFVSGGGSPLDFYFPTDRQIQKFRIMSVDDIQVMFKTYRLFGISYLNSQANTRQVSSNPPSFLYTPYIDIFSNVLTNYQKVKDTTTQINNYSGMVGRVYLSGTNVQSTRNTEALGSDPFVVTQDMNTPKIIKWTPDVSVTSIDFQMRDCYGELLPSPPRYSTEFQITLLCTEGDY